MSALPESGVDISSGVLARRTETWSPGQVNSRAWLLATCPDDQHRDGRQAVESAKSACEWTEWKDHRYIDTLAAAYADVGDFDEAVKTQIQAIRIK